MDNVDEAARLKQEIAFLTGLISRHKGSNHVPQPATATSSRWVQSAKTSRQWVASGASRPQMTSSRYTKNALYGGTQVPEIFVANTDTESKPNILPYKIKSSGKPSGTQVKEVSKMKSGLITCESKKKLLVPGGSSRVVIPPVSSSTCSDATAMKHAATDGALAGKVYITKTTQASSNVVRQVPILKSKPVVEIQAESKKRTVIPPSKLTKEHQSSKNEIFNARSFKVSSGHPVSDSFNNVKIDPKTVKDCTGSCGSASQTVVKSGKEKLPVQSTPRVGPRQPVQADGVRQVQNPVISGVLRRTVSCPLIQLQDTAASLTGGKLTKFNSGSGSAHPLKEENYKRCHDDCGNKPFKWVSVKVQGESPVLPPKSVHKEAQKESKIEAGKRIVQEIEKLNKAVAAIEKASSEGKQKHPKQSKEPQTTSCYISKDSGWSPTDQITLQGPTMRKVLPPTGQLQSDTKAFVNCQGSKIVRKTRYSIRKMRSVKKGLSGSPKISVQSNPDMKKGGSQAKFHQSALKTRQAVVQGTSGIHKSGGWVCSSPAEVQRHKYIRWPSLSPVPSRPKSPTVGRGIGKSPQTDLRGKRVVVGKHKLLRASIFKLNHHRCRSPFTGRIPSQTPVSGLTRKPHLRKEKHSVCDKQSLTDLMNDVSLKTAKIKHSQRILRRALLFNQNKPRKKVSGSKLRPYTDSSRLKWKASTDGNPRTSQQQKVKSKLGLKRKGMKNDEWKTRFSLKRNNAEQALSINKLLGRTVNNLSSDRYKFISGNTTTSSAARVRTPIPRHVLERSLRQMPRRFQRDRQTRLKLDHRRAIAKGPPQGLSPKQPVAGGHLVQIGGILYKSSQRRLRRTGLPEQTLKLQPKTRSSRKIVLKSMCSLRMKMVRVRGVKFKVDNRGHTLQRVVTGSPVKAGSPVFLKRVDLGGVTYMQTKPGTLVRVNTTSVRATASRSIQRSIVTAATAARLKRVHRKRQYCMFYNRFGKCNRGDQCPYIHDPEKVAVCTRFLRGTCKITDCPFSHQVAPEKMPVCTHFLRGVCTRDNCPYLHVNVSKDAAVCNDFLRGYCPLGDKCKKKHSRVCPNHDGTGSCPRKAACRLDHPKPRKRPQTSSISSKRVVKRQRTTTRRVEVDDKDLPFKERCLPAFISLASVESAANDLDQDSSNLVTSPTPKEPLQIWPNLSFEPDNI